eukprot:TRINITY_DN781_c4_g1_i1.p1 TRINITY_DN781_c4_g1~~TRINITY_DN781_c4_g1_i1.p1  ORF type:complete len:246 (+),score=47.74 TRINITY_DN781_c4_g1_i1:54-791(+)
MSEYDQDASVYSPEGKIIQLDYAAKAVDNLGTAVGVCCKDGVVVGVEKLIGSRMMTPGTNTRIQRIDRHSGCVVAGLLPDGRHLVSRAREDAENFRSTYGFPITGKLLADRIGSLAHYYTLTRNRPFGCALVMGTYGEDGPQLHLLDPSGHRFSYFGCSIGKAKTLAKTELEKIEFDKITCVEAVKEIAKILHLVHDDQKDKLYEMELAWVTKDNGKNFEPVPSGIAEPALEAAKKEAAEARKDQ